MFENGTGEAMDYVAYYRVSTAGQARSGLGLAAQQEIVSRFVKPGDRLLESSWRCSPGVRTTGAALESD
jgi:hypothetical protein